VRELENVISRSILKASLKSSLKASLEASLKASLKASSAASREAPVVISPEHLGFDFTGAAERGFQSPPREENPFSSGIALKDAVETYKRKLVLAALDRHRGNLAAAARDLGMHRSNLHHLVKRLGLKDAGRNAPSN
jgi:anaerobic nitric oxide reductase transcription regulator